VGDPNQAIYGWRGAQDAMAGFGGQELRLTGSYRFGPAIAEEANRWLELLGSDMRLRGWKKLNSTLDDREAPVDAVLCRTNGHAIAEVMSGLDQGKRVALVGGGGAMESMAKAAAGLMSGQGTEHPELIGFADWQEVVQHSKEDEGRDLAPFVQVINSHGVEAVLNCCRALSEEERAELVVSTAHKSKGREWRGVQIAGDFGPSGKKAGRQALGLGTDDLTGAELPGRDELMLSYVAITRAKDNVNRGGLRYIDLVAPRGQLDRLDEGGTVCAAPPEDGYQQALRLLSEDDGDTLYE
jgi:superfamily I DNA/RNA helicase